MNIVIIGLGTGGFAAHLYAKRACRDAKVIIVDRKEFNLFHPCGLPFILDKTLDAGKLEHMLNLKGTEVLQSHECLKIIPDANEVLIQQVGTDKRRRIPYDRLIIATGSTASIPPIDGIRPLLGKSIFTLHCTDDAKKIIAKEKKHILIVGAGPIGLESAAGLRKTCKVTVVEALSNVFPRSLDTDMAKMIEEYLVTKGVMFHFGKLLSKILSESDSLVGVKIGEEEIRCDTILLSCGARVDLKMFSDAGLLIGDHGLKVNSRMQTNHKNIYAVGDIVETKIIGSEQKLPSRLATLAYAQGKAAGINSVGGDAFYHETNMAFASMIGDLEVASVGMTSKVADDSGYSVIAVKVRSTDIPEWAICDEKKHDITLKIIIDKTTLQVLGCQSVGIGAAAKVNVVAAAIASGLTADKLADVELAYCPSISNLPDVLSVACETAVRRARLS
ncbi:hypothetical protein COV93_00495 [Candidatus Woesearchaeota archaeon CG11_big_fil_rev_8_21_14_0_20_43_8]|nr:MAG: hypothetical protein COV93_00495 [Candidatus Woesearchaeota archaeon CG11_big_fil_rev_8_21_14_0_20_43_8]PIO04907.1 MAG: hypothetical protein COT47_07030 [Candidatus Woesearchaeota archaeon CG08_land_8_20_14_0_20_43_7]